MDILVTHIFWGATPPVYRLPTLAKSDIWGRWANGDSSESDPVRWIRISRDMWTFQTFWGGEDAVDMSNSSTFCGYTVVNVYITDGKDPPFLMGKSPISMVIFNSYVSLPEGTMLFQGVQENFVIHVNEILYEMMLCWKDSQHMPTQPIWTNHPNLIRPLQNLASRRGLEAHASSGWDAGSSAHGQGASQCWKKSGKRSPFFSTPLVVSNSNISFSVLVWFIYNYVYIYIYIHRYVWYV